MCDATPSGKGMKFIEKLKIARHVDVPSQLSSQMQISEVEYWSQTRKASRIELTLTLLSGGGVDKPVIGCRLRSCVSTSLY